METVYLSITGCVNCPAHTLARRHTGDSFEMVLDPTCSKKHTATIDIEDIKEMSIPNWCLLWQKVKN